MSRLRYTLLERHALQARYSMSGAFNRVIGGSRPRPIVFIHVPKAAGSSLSAYLKACAGSRQSGRTVTLELAPHLIHEADILAARRAAFCSGHISWPTFLDIKNGRDVFAFTFLRHPVDRVRSLYYFMKANAERVGERLLPGIGRMTPVEFASCHEPGFRYWIDDYMARQFGGSLASFPENDVGKQEIVLRAGQNLKSLNFVGFFDRMDQDFRELIKRAGLPRIGSAPRYNTTPKSAAGRGGSEFEERVTELLAPRLRLDMELWEFSNQNLR